MSAARRWTLVATSLGFAVVQLDVSVVNVAIKPIGESLDGGVSSLQWVVSAHTVAFAALILTAGALSDRAGAKRVFIAGCAALLGAGAGTPYGTLVLQLLAIGFGLGLSVPAMTSSLLGSVERSQSGVASGTLNSARQTGSVIGVALFGSLIAGGGALVSGLHVALEISVGLVLAVAALSVGIGRSRGEKLSRAAGVDRGASPAG